MPPSKRPAPANTVKGLRWWLLVLRDGAALRTPATEGELRALLDRLEEPAERTRVQDVLSLYGASGG
jgi:hypothetical protein